MDSKVRLVRSSELNNRNGAEEVNEENLIDLDSVVPDCVGLNIHCFRLCNHSQLAIRTCWANVAHHCGGGGGRNGDDDGSQAESHFVVGRPLRDAVEELHPLDDVVAAGNGRDEAERAALRAIRNSLQNSLHHLHH